MKKFFLIATIFLGINGCVLLKSNETANTISFYSQISNLSSDELNREQSVKTIINPFFEKSIYSYLSQGVMDEVIVKKGGFVANKPVGIETYKYGYYIINMNLLSKAKRLNKGFDIDSIAVMKLFISLDSIQSIESKHTNDISPFCGGQYKQLNVKFKSLYLGNIKQRLPLFLDCDGYKSYAKAHDGRSYQIDKIPTYLIINVQ